MLLEAIVKCYIRVSIKALIYITHSVIALIKTEPHTISDESRVGWSVVYVGSKLKKCIGFFDGVGQDG
jgi:hypothetical protein